MPGKVGDVGSAGSGSSAGLHGDGAIKCGVHPRAIVTIPEGGERSFEVKTIPEQDVIEKLPPDRPNEALNKWMR